MSRPRERFSTQISAEVQARARATVRGMTSAIDPDYSLAQFTEDAINAYCREMETQHNHGKPWPRSERRLRPGPRVG